MTSQFYARSHSLICTCPKTAFSALQSTSSPHLAQMEQVRLTLFFALPDSNTSQRVTMSVWGHVVVIILLYYYRCWGVMAVSYYYIVIDVGASWRYYIIILLSMLGRHGGICDQSVCRLRLDHFVPCVKISLS